MYKRLEKPEGATIEQKKNDTDSAKSIVRKAILVHSGPEGEAITFQSSDGEIHFDDARVKEIVEAQNAVTETLASEYGGFEKIPVGAFPPILDQHANDSNDRIRGRLTGKLSFEVRDVPKVGKNVSCAVCDITFLGEDTVEKVNDGRIYHLSVGIGDDPDSIETYNTLGETSTVIEPAAAGAMLLNKSKKASVKSKKLTKITKKGDLMAGTKSYQKRLKAHESRKKILSSAGESLKQMSAKLVTASDKVQLAKKHSDISNGFAKLMKSGKMTPAEFKKQDIKKLSALPADAVKAVMQAYESREPQIDPSQRGSSDAPDASSIAQNLEKKQMSRLAAEIKGDFKKLGAKMKHMGEDKDKEDIHEKSEKKMADKPEHDEKHLAEEKHLNSECMKHMEAAEKHMEEGKHEEAKAELKKMKEHMSKHGLKHMAEGDHGIADVKSEDEMKSMEEMKSEVDELKTNMARMAGMIEELMGVEKEEGEHLEEEAAEHAKLEDHEDGDDEDDKHLSEEEKEEKKKLAEKEEADKKKLAEDEEKKAKLKKELKNKK